MAYRRKIEHVHQQLAEIQKELMDLIGDESNEDIEDELISQAVDSIGDALDDLESILMQI